MTIAALSVIALLLWFIWRALEEIAKQLKGLYELAKQRRGYS